MHAALYVCLPRSEARTSLQARKKVCKYLSGQGFDTLLRFSGRCDYFCVGGRWSGRLTLLRLRHEQPKVFDRFWKQLNKLSNDENAAALFRKAFPDFQGKLPINRGETEFEGEADDAQIMDESLFEQLKAGFSEDINYSYELTQPNVIWTDELDDSEWPQTVEQAEQFWVVLIDYHH